MSKIIKSSQHTTKFANIGKRDINKDFLIEYDRVVWWFVDYLWNNTIHWKNGTLDIKNNKFDTPDFISTTNLSLVTELSARAVKIASGEAIAIIKSQTEKRRKQLFVLAKKMRDGDKSIGKLQSKIDSNPVIKPTKTGKNLIANLNSNCCQFIPDISGEFDGWLRIHAIGKRYGHIYMPIKFTRHSKNLAKKGYTLMSSWKILNGVVYSTWQMEKPKSIGTRIIGADQGYVTCLSLSDGQVTGKDNHGHDLYSIIDTMSRRKKGSNGFKRAQEQRKNYINWSINQLDLTDIKELRLERLFQMRKGTNMGNKLGHWTYTEINTQIISRCDELGVPVKEQSATYRSQRCSDCGWTQKSNRKGKEFICKQCGSIHDADINGALNHEADIYQLPVGFWQTNPNRKGFYWTIAGIYDISGFDLSGGAFIVPYV